MKLQFGYDEQDQRLWTRRFARSGTEWTLEKEVRFVYSGGELVAEYEKQGIGSLTLVRSYVWGVDGLVSMKDHVSGSTYLALVDGSGSVVGLAGSDGVVAAVYEYGPFGRLLGAEGPAAGMCRVRWQGMYEEPELGLYYARHRYYAPALERWLSRDPIEEAGGANLYAFCRNDPVNYTDRSGLERQSGVYGDIRSNSSVWNEAKAEVAARYGLSGSLDQIWSQQISTGFLSSATVGELVTAAYSARVSQYRRSGTEISGAAAPSQRWAYAKAYTAGAAIGGGTSVRNTAVVLWRGGTEVVLGAMDCGNSYIYLRTGRSVYCGELSELGKASMESDFSYISHLAETGMNAISAGMHSQAELTCKYFLLGDIDLQTYTENMGAIGALQVTGGLAAKYGRGTPNATRAGAAEGAAASFDSAGQIVRNGTRPIMAQGGRPTCGPVSVEMILDTLNPSRTSTSIVDLALSSKGTTMDRLASMLNKNGVTARYLPGQAVEDLAAATARGNPAIARVLTPEGPHFVVVDGVTTRMGQRVVAIRDPRGVQYFEQVGAFSKRFTGHVVTLGQ